MKAIRTRYLGPTNSKGARIIADDGDGNRTTYAYDYALDTKGNHRQAAYQLMARMNWDGFIIGGNHGNAYFWVFQS